MHLEEGRKCFLDGALCEFLLGYFISTSNREGVSHHQPIPEHFLSWRVCMDFLLHPPKSIYCANWLWRCDIFFLSQITTLKKEQFLFQESRHVQMSSHLSSFFRWAEQEPTYQLFLHLWFEMLVREGKLSNNVHSVYLRDLRYSVKGGGRRLMLFQRHSRWDLEDIFVTAHCTKFPRTKHNKYTSFKWVTSVFQK